MKKILSFLIAICMLITAMPLTAHAEPAYTETFEVSNAAQLEAAATTINTATEDNSTYLITLEDDITGNISISNAKTTTTILGEGNSIASSGSSIIDASNGATINLGAPDYNKTLTLEGTTTGSDPGAIYSLDGSTVNMYKRSFSLKARLRHRRP